MCSYATQNVRGEIKAFSHRFCQPKFVPQSIPKRMSEVNMHLRNLTKIVSWDSRLLRCWSLYLPSHIVLQAEASLVLRGKSRVVSIVQTYHWPDPTCKNMYKDRQESDLMELCPLKCGVLIALATLAQQPPTISLSHKLPLKGFAIISIVRYNEIQP